MDMARPEQAAEPDVVLPPTPASAMSAGGSGRGDDHGRREHETAGPGRRDEHVIDDDLLRLALDENEDLFHRIRPSFVGRPPRRFISHRLPVE